MSKQSCKYVGFIVDKIKNLSKKENTSISDSINSYNKNKVKLSPNDSITELAVKYNLSLPEDILTILNTLTEFEHKVMVMYFLNRIVTGNKPPVKIDKLDIGEIQLLTNAIKQNINILVQ